MSVSGVVGQFAYFDAQLDHPDWRGKRVLDIGGNVGNFLLDASPEVNPRNYWSIDLSRDGIEEGRRRHPEANFVFYDRYSPQYNPTGQHDLPIPDVGVRFDIIIGYSVATHLSRSEFLRLVEELNALAADGGVIALTFLDPTWRVPEGWFGEAEPGMTLLEWWIRRVNPSTDSVEALLARAHDVTQPSGITWVTVADVDDLRLDPEDDAWHELTPSEADRIIRWREAAPHEKTLYLTLCTSAYMRQLLPSARIRPPVPPSVQHCVAIPAGAPRPRSQGSAVGVRG